MSCIAVSAPLTWKLASVPTTLFLWTNSSSRGKTRASYVTIRRLDLNMTRIWKRKKMPEEQWQKIWKMQKLSPQWRASHIYGGHNSPLAVKWNHYFARYYVCRFAQVSSESTIDPVLRKTWNNSHCVLPQCNTQPMDVTVFRILKKNWKNKVYSWRHPIWRTQS